MAACITETFFTAWPVVASAFTVTGGLIAVKLTHHYTHTRELQMLEEKQRREKKDVAEKREAEFLYICTELIFRLEKFAEKCAFVAADSGIQPLKDEEWVASTPTPVLTLEGTVAKIRQLTGSGDEFVRGTCHEPFQRPAFYPRCHPVGGTLVL